MAERTKVEVGQVWTRLGNPKPFKITSLFNRRARAEYEGREDIFCTLDADGFPVSNEMPLKEWAFWTITPPQPPPQGEVAPSSGGMTFAQWLTAPRPGNCVCNIPRHQCRFHQ